METAKSEASMPDLQNVRAGLRNIHLTLIKRLGFGGAVSCPTEFSQPALGPNLGFLGFAQVVSPTSPREKEPKKYNKQGSNLTLSSTKWRD